eukprot:s3074_g5.t1
MSLPLFCGVLASPSSSVSCEIKFQQPEPEFTYKEYKVVGTVPLQSHWHFLLLCCCHFLNSLPRLSGRPAFEPETLLK